MDIATSLVEYFFRSKGGPLICTQKTKKKGAHESVWVVGEVGEGQNKIDGRKGIGLLGVQVHNTALCISGPLISVISGLDC